MRGKKGLIALVIIVLISGGIWVWWRSPSSSLAKEVKQEAGKLKPDLKVASLNITDIDQDKLRAVAELTLKNNLPVEVKTSRLDYVIYIDSAKVIEDAYQQPIVLNPSATTGIVLPMELRLDQMAAVLKRFDKQQTDSADYSLKATFRVDVPIAGERDFTMHFTRRMPALRLPQVKMKEVDLGKLGLKRTGLNMVVQVKNPNGFPIKMKNGKFRLQIDNDAQMMQGTMEPIVGIPAHGSEEVNMHVDVKTLKVPKLGWKMLFDKQDTKFRMKLNCTLLSDNGMLNNSKMVITMEGTLKELADAGKEVKKAKG